MAGVLTYQPSGLGSNLAPFYGKSFFSWLQSDLKQIKVEAVDARWYLLASLAFRNKAIIDKPSLAIYDQPKKVKGI